MLTTLRIKNLALVDDLTLELQGGYAVITGETGAGKSIIIGALNLVLGERADRTLIRAGCDSCTVEAVFDISSVMLPLAPFLEENGLEPCEDGQLLLKRVFSAAGSNRQFVNGSATTLNVLGTLGESLVDMHGPHDHQSLLHSGRQLDILDAHGGLMEQRKEFAQLVRRRAQLLSEKTALIVDEKTYAQQLDLLRHQVNEIQAAQLQSGEDTEVEEAYCRAANSARLLELSQTALQSVSENDASLLNQAGLVTRALQELTHIDPAATPLLQQQEQIVESLRELTSDISHYADKVELDPARLQALEDRLNLLQSLKRKYGPKLEDVLAFGADASRKLQVMEQRDEELARLNTALEAVQVAILKAGRDLSAQRRKVIPKLSKAVSRQLQDLGFQQSRLDIALECSLPDGAAATSAKSRSPLTPSRSPIREEGTRRAAEGDSQHPSNAPSFSKPRLFPEPNVSGFDSVEFQFAPNPGEPTRPLRAIASSGELARVMLALKTVLAAEDEIPVLVFDEVDANVGGETAHSVGEKMQALANRRQVLCITHLPQVAAPAAVHYVVIKEEQSGRTLSRIQRLSDDERIGEISRMLGGGEAAVEHAKAMLHSVSTKVARKPAPTAASGTGSRSR